jgi:hypothetical protein
VPINPIPDSRIERELAKMLQVPVPYNTVRNLPYGELGQRRLELLLYVLFQRGVESNWFPGEFDRVHLATAPSGAGRLLLLDYKKQRRGAVLVRPRPGPLHTPEMARELLRFLLFHLAGHGPDFEARDFHLFLAAPGGVNDQAADFAADFSQRMAKEARLSYWVAELIESHARLKGLSPKDALASLDDLLPLLHLELILPPHIDRRLGEAPDLKSIFFGVEMVTSEQVLRHIVSGFNLKALEDQEAQQLVERLEKWPMESRMGLGMINFFGYPREFLQSVAGSDKLRSILIKGAEFKTEIDYAVVAFLHEKAVFFSNVLLGDAPEEVGDLARLGVVPFVFSRFVIKYVKDADSKALRELLQSGQRLDFYEDADLDAILNDLLDQVENADPQATPPANASPRQIKRLEAVLRAQRNNSTREARSQRFHEDWTLLKPVLAAIDKRMLQILPRHPIIVLDDLSNGETKGGLGPWLSRFRKRLSGES